LLNTTNGEELQDIKVRLFSSYTGKTAILSAKKSNYYLIANDTFGNPIDTITRLDSKGKNRGVLYLWIRSGKVYFKKGGINLGGYKNVTLKSSDVNSSFKIKYSTIKERVYDGSLIIKPNNNIIELVNDVNMQSYVAGVVESEIGSRGNLEFYKVQAILVRTYALKNFDKFKEKGYNLTDDVRSQVYFSKSHFSRNSKLILQAVKQTKGLVIVGKTNNIIDPVFHANSGGQTLNASDVWSFEFPYLQSVKDPYSTMYKGGNSSWKKEISINRYLQYFYKMAPKYRHNSGYKNAILTFNQSKRESVFRYKEITIPLKQIRSEFKLKSTFFNVKQYKTKVVLYGKGYGHGVGLSQIGAINMVKSGFTYKQIIKFYFKNVSIVKLEDITFAYSTL